MSIYNVFDPSEYCVKDYELNKNFYRYDSILKWILDIRTDIRFFDSRSKDCFTSGRKNDTMFLMRVRNKYPSF
jgi:hypothetical protein